MNLATAQWLLEGAHAFQKDPKLKEWNGLQREYFVWLLTSIFKVETFIEAVSLLEKVVNKELNAPSITTDLATKLEAWKKAKEEKEEIRKRIAEEVQKWIDDERKRIKPVLPLAEAAKEAVKEIPKKKVVTPPPPEAFHKEIIEKLAVEEGVAFVPIFTLLQPKVAFSFAKKVALSPIVKTVQFVDKVAGEALPVEVAKTVPEERQAVSEFRELLHQGLTAKDVEESITAFQEAGLPPDHPELVELEKKRIGLETYEKTHRLFTGILKQYHEFSKITGRRQIYLPEIKSYLPKLSQLPVWVKKRGYSWTLRQTLTKIGTGLRLYQKLPIAPEKTIIYFSLPDTLTKLLTLGKVKSFQTIKTAVYQKALKPIIVRLRKTGIGKAAAWILIKLGFASLPEPVSKILLVASLVWDAAKAIWRKAKPIVKKLALFLIGAAFAFAGLVVGFPISLVCFGLSALSLGTAIFGPAVYTGLVTGVSTLASQTTAILTGIFTSITAPITGTVGALAVVGTILAIAGLAFYIVLTTSAAFILPVEPTAELEEVQSPYIAVTKTANPSTAVSPPVEISYTIQVTAKQETITNIRIDNQTTVTNQNRSFSITNDKDGNSITSFSCPDLDPGETCTKEYVIRAESSDFENSAIFDAAIVLANVPSKNLTNEKSSASASVIIGNPPTYCFALEGTWLEGDKAIETQAISFLSQAQDYIKKLCADGAIYLVRTYSNPGWSGETHGPNTIILFNKNFSSVRNAIFTLAHESGHILSHRVPGDYQSFVNSGVYVQEGYICSYPFGKSISEDFAEMIGNYVLSVAHSCFGGKRFDERYPKHFQFAKDQIFTGFRYY